MTNNKQEVIVEANNIPTESVGQVKDNTDVVLQAKKEVVAKQIEEILKEAKLILFPYLDRQQNATVARVTLMEDTNVKS